MVTMASKSIDSGESTRAKDLGQGGMTYSNLQHVSLQVAPGLILWKAMNPG
jgi:hypothetical protein